jgi:hypothetical protein
MWGGGVLYRDLFGKPVGRRPLVIPRGTWKDSIKMDLKEIRWESLEWIL